MIDILFPHIHRWFCSVRSHRCRLLMSFVSDFLPTRTPLHKILQSRAVMWLLLLLVSLPLSAQLAQVLPQRALSKWGIPAGNYSGITPLGNGRFAVVSDKAPSLCYFEWEILQDSLTGQVTYVSALGFRPLQAGANLPATALDVEDLVFDAQRKLVWIANEGDQTLTAYDTATQQLGATMVIPPYFSRNSIFANLGFEALAYDARTQLWCTTSESPLRVDAPARPEQLLPTVPLDLRLTFWDSTFTAQRIVPYRMGTSQLSRQARYYLQGVPALCFLPNGSLLVMERELSVPRTYLGAKCHIRLRWIASDALQQWAVSMENLSSDSRTTDTMLIATPWHALAPQTPVVEVAEWYTQLGIFSRSLANYEGMCLGRRLADGRQTVLCVSDAQGGAGRCGVHLRDFLRVVVLDRECTD